MANEKKDIDLDKFLGKPEEIESLGKIPDKKLLKKSDNNKKKGLTDDA